MLFTVSTNDTYAVGRVLCAVCTLCSVFRLFTAVIEFTVFCSYNIYTMVGRAMYSRVNIVWGLGGLCHVGWRVGCWSSGGLFRIVGDMRHSSS